MSNYFKIINDYYETIIIIILFLSFIVMSLLNKNIHSAIGWSCVTGIYIIFVITIKKTSDKEEKNEE